MTRRLLLRSAVVLAASGCVVAIDAPAAIALNPLKPVCGAVGLLSGLAGKACSVVQHGGRVVQAGKNLVGGHLGGAANALLGGTSGNTTSSATTALGLAAVGAWVLGGAHFALHETAKVLGETTTPQLGTTWFSSAYWRIAGIAAVLTLPFLFAAAIQALLRSDLTLLARAALGYLPLAFLAVSVAAPIAMLLLAASDQMSAIVASAGGPGATHFLVLAGAGAGLISLLHGSAFLAFLVGLFTVAGAIVLWLELLAREAAVYVVVLMLPLAFAALVWPARRVWAIRAVELLVALILSKFAIVAVLSLGGAALGHGSGLAGMLAGFVLVVLGAFAPWALLRLLPLAELASGAAGSLRSEARGAHPHFERAADEAAFQSDWAGTVTARMRDQAAGVDAVGDRAVDGTGGEAATAEAERLADVDDTLAPSGELDGRTADAESDLRSAGANGGSGAAAGSAGAAVATSNGSSTSTGERIPGMGPMWQAPDTSWRPLTLGLQEGGEPPRVWPPEGEADEAAGQQRTVDEPDPLPPTQEPGDGAL